MEVDAVLGVEVHVEANIELQVRAGKKVSLLVEGKAHITSELEFEIGAEFQSRSGRC